jgi:hypothetical protein
VLPGPEAAAIVAARGDAIVTGMTQINTNGLVLIVVR